MGQLSDFISFVRRWFVFDGTEALLASRLYAWANYNLAYGRRSGAVYFDAPALSVTVGEWNVDDDDDTEDGQMMFRIDGVYIYADVYDGGDVDGEIGVALDGDDEEVRLPADAAAFIIRNIPYTLTEHWTPQDLLAGWAEVINARPGVPVDMRVLLDSLMEKYL
jgi:hypothetical protein